MSASVVLQTCFTLLFLSVLWSLLPLLSNIRKCQKIGLPYYITPLGDSVTTFLINNSPLRGWINFVPLSLKNYAYMSFISHRWKARSELHDKLGPVILHVTPRGIAAYVADAEAVLDITSRRNEFPKPIHDYSILKLFGENVVAAEGDDWAVHRRYTQSPFNERNSNLVWQDSISQACGMISSWGNKEPIVATARSWVPGALEDFRKLALHVISSAGFGVYLKFDLENRGAHTEASSTSLIDELSTSSSPRNGCTRNFREALQYYQQNIVHILFVLSTFPKTFLDHYAPPSLQKYKVAFDDVDHYLQALVRNEKEMMKKLETENIDANRRSNLLSSLVRLQDSKGPSDPTLRTQRKLTTREIVGNAFIFSVAGHETTAITLQYAVAMLILHPDKQTWLQNQLKEVLRGESEDPRDWDYSLFAKLDTPLAIMFETLRLFPPVPTIPKWTSRHPQQLSTAGGTYNLPAGTMVNINVPGLHYSKQYWGSDAEEFNPQRWDVKNTSSFIHNNEGIPAKGAATGVSPRLNKPTKGSWVPFSEGSRACMAKKFAQVEFVAVLVVVFSKFTIGLQLLDNETEVEGKQRLERNLCESTNLNGLRPKEGFEVTLEPIV